MFKKIVLALVLASFVGSAIQSAEARATDGGYDGPTEPSTSSPTADGSDGFNPSRILRLKMKCSSASGSSLQAANYVAGSGETCKKVYAH